ncbi:MAG: putative lipase [Aeromicrobium sp.]|nr:putative lipase [Aeromicrobium sp.]
MTIRILTAAMVAVALTAMVPSLASAETYAPTNRPGPPLSVSTSTLAKSLSCSGNLRTSSFNPILLVPGTTVTPEQDFSWNYERAFTQQGRPWCAVTLPASTMGDIQIAGEYVVYAIRTMHAESGKKLEIVGHSQGGMVPRWALRFWPDTRADVADVIGMAPSNHGTVVAVPLCLPVVGCAPAIWQQIYRSPFIQALNSRAETFPGISYTNIYTVLDEVVQPNVNDAGSSSLHGGGGDIANISVQAVCPAHVTDHLLIGTADPVAYALVMDAMGHAGPAKVSRIDHSVCRQLLQPGVNPVTFATDFANTSAHLAVTLAATPHVAKPPALKAYVHN